MRRWTTGVAVLGFLLAFGRPAAAADERVDRVLAAHRAAVGPAPAHGTLRLTYRFHGQGLDGTVTTRFDAATGAHVTESALGPIAIANGFDGRTPWMRDPSGAATTQEGGDRVPMAVNEAYRLANRWWRRDRGGARIRYVGQPAARGALHHLSVTPQGGAPFDAWFDRRSGHLVRIAERQMFFDTRTTYADPAAHGGMRLARRIIVDGGTGPDGLATLDLVAVARGPRRALATYARPDEPLRGVTIDADSPRAIVPFRLLNNHIYVEGHVDGRGPYTFIVDTGGHTILSSRVVAEAGLQAQGAVPSAGAGEATSTSGYLKVHEIAIGPVRMRDQTVIAMDIYDPAVEGIRVDGMVGFELFRRLAVSIDYGAGRLVFSRFDAFDAAAAGTAIPFKFYDHIPQVEGRVDDLPARLNIDTGSRSEVDLTQPFVAAGGLLSRWPDGFTAMTGWGVGGPSMSQVVRLPSLSLGPVTVHAPVAGLSSARRGSFSDANYDGNVGSGLLKRFVTSFDYARQRMYLRPIEPPPADAGSFDRSGLWLNASADGFTVMHVSPGGPADLAGVIVGDLVTRIDGGPAVGEELAQARMLLRTRLGGSRVPLLVQRAGAQLAIDLVLRDRLQPAATPHRKP